MNENSAEKESPPAAAGLSGCRLSRPDPFGGKVEITVAPPSSRAFPARLTTSLGICLKRGEAHAIESNGVRMVYPANALCLRFPGTVWSSEAAAVGFVSVDIDPEYVGFDIRDESIRFIPDAALDLERIAAALENAQTGLTRELILAELIDSVSSYIRNAPRSDDPSASTARAAVARTRRMIEDSLLENLSLEDLARSTGQNKFLLIRRFKRALGIPPHRYAIHVRVAKARELLAKGVSASEAAMAVGLSDQAHLNRHFLRIVGVTPAQYARQKRFVAAAGWPSTSEGGPAAAPGEN